MNKKIIEQSVKFEPHHSSSSFVYWKCCECNDVIKCKNPFGNCCRLNPIIEHLKKNHTNIKGYVYDFYDDIKEVSLSYFILDS